MKSLPVSIFGERVAVAISIINIYLVLIKCRLLKSGQGLNVKVNTKVFKDNLSYASINFILMTTFGGSVGREVVKKWPVTSAFSIFILYTLFEPASFNSNASINKRYF